MRQVLRALISVVVLAAGAAQAQDQDAWVQIEAQPTLAQAEERARAWASAFPDVSGYRLSTGWYVVVLGPYQGFQAEGQLVRLQAEQLIPRDSFLTDGGNFASRFWPVGAGALAPAAQPAAEPATQPVAEPAPEVAAAVAAPSLPEAAPEPEAPPAPETGPDPESPADARRSESQLTADERKDLQVALKWFGYYDSAIDGAFGRGTRASMAAWQADQGHDDTGVLTTRQRARLLGDYHGELAALGLGTVNELKSGIEIEMPVGLVEFDAYAYPFVRYRETGNSGVRVLLISQEGTEATLAGLYDVMQSLEIVPLEGARERGRDSFTLTGQNEVIHSHTYARLDEGMVKGFTIVYPPEAEDRMQKAIAIMRDTLRSTGPALDPAMGATDAVQSRDLLSGLEIRRPERTGSGFYVSDNGAVVTVAEAVAGCTRVLLDDTYEAAVVAQDATSGLALLKPAEALAPMAVAALAAGEPRIGGAAAVAGYSFGGALPAPAVTFGTVEDVAGLNGEAGLLRLQAETEPGDVGGPVFDEAGQVTGILLPVAEGSRQLPPGVRFAAKATILAGFLSGNGIETASAEAESAMAPEDITRAGMDMTVLVSCWN